MAHKALIFGCSTTSLTSAEHDFFAEHCPWGFILFSRNVECPAQLRDLCASLRESIGSPSAPILIDQEGGRVQRLGPPHWREYPSARKLSSLYTKSPDISARAVWLLSRLHAFDLSSVGINVNCLPVLDLSFPETHSVIGDRSYSDNIDCVIDLGKMACSGLRAGGVLPIVKHIPGHGRAVADSHHELPRVTASHSDLSTNDFVPFKALSDELMAMTAHIVYESLDSTTPATTSAHIIDTIIRGEIGFDNLLMSDDISMKALSGDYATRTKSIFDAGCDIVLHCNGDLSQMREIANSASILSGKPLERCNSVLANLSQIVDNSIESSLRAEFDSLLLTIKD